MPQTLDIKPKFKLPVFVNVNKHVKDISFENFFWKKFVIRLCILFIASTIILSICSPLAVQWQQNMIDNNLSNAALEIGRLESSGMPKDRVQTTVNVILSKIQDDLDKNPFIVGASLSSYNMTQKYLLAHSFEIPVIHSDDVYKQWMANTKLNDGYPLISLPQGIKEFCEKYEDKFISVDKLCCLNSVLVPVIVSAMDNQKAIETYQTPFSSTAQVITSYQPIQLEIVGNDENDPAYSAMKSYEYKTNDDGKAVVVYADVENANMLMMSKDFEVNNIDYRIDCGYQISFWAGAWLYVLIGELVAILLCALSALLNTKETLNVLR
jgi:hypothetical protein